MPTSILTSSQRKAFGRFSKSPTSAELERYFHLDEIDTTLTRQMRGMANKFGFALLLCSSRFTGRFPLRLDDIPDEVVTYLADQLRVRSPENLNGYFDPSGPTYKRHTALIRSQFGYRDFQNSPDAVFALSRKLYTFCWVGDDKPGHLIEWARVWLIENKILLPGATTLERLVGRIRDRVRRRLWLHLVKGLSVEQRTQINALFSNDADDILAMMQMTSAILISCAQAP